MTTKKPQVHLINGSIIEADAIQFKSMGILQVVMCFEPKMSKNKLGDLMPVMIFPMSQVLGVGLDESDIRTHMRNPIEN